MPETVKIREERRMKRTDVEKRRRTESAAAADLEEGMRMPRETHRHISARFLYAHVSIENINADLVRVLVAIYVSERERGRERW